METLSFSASVRPVRPDHDPIDMTGPILAVDWGTTNVRAWVVGPDGSVFKHQNFAVGIGGLAPGEAEQRFRHDIVPAMAAQTLPALLCGMIGSNLGWTAVRYLDCPVGLAALGAALHPVGDQTWIVPGLRAVRPDGGPDVMRGEETQVFGWLTAAAERSIGEHLLCLPGTHTKWARISNGRIETFVTAMSGELFALLRQHSSLRVADAVDDDTAFADGLTAAGDGNALASLLFTARSRLVGGDLPAVSVQSYLSGVLIGAEVASTPALLNISPGAQIEVIGDVQLGRRYGLALERLGYRPAFTSGETAAKVGLLALHRMVAS